VTGGDVAAAVLQRSAMAAMMSVVARVRVERTIFVAGAHRDDGQRFIVRAAL